MVPGILEDEKLSADPRLEFESHALRRIRWPGIPVIDGIPGHNVFAVCRFARKDERLVLPAGIEPASNTWARRMVVAP